VTPSEIRHKEEPSERVDGGKKHWGFLQAGSEGLMIVCGMYGRRQVSDLITGQTTHRDVIQDHQSPRGRD